MKMLFATAVAVGVLALSLPYSRGHAQSQHNFSESVYDQVEYGDERARTGDEHAHDKDERNNQRTCVVTHNTPDLSESALTMPPWIRVPCDEE